MSRQTNQLHRIPEEYTSEMLDNSLDPELHNKLPECDLSPDNQQAEEENIPPTMASDRTLQDKPQAEPTAKTNDEISSYHRRNTLVGHQLGNKDNNSRIPEGTTVPVELNLN